MDIAATLSHLVTSLLPAEQAALVHAHILRADAPLRVTFSAARASALRGASAAYPYVAPACERVLSALGGGGVVVPLLVVAAAVVVMNWVRRAVLWWARLAVRAVAWAAVAAMAAWAWQRGPAEAAREVVAAGGRLAGWAAVVREIWLREYRRYEEQENRGR